MYRLRRYTYVFTNLLLTLGITAGYCQSQPLQAVESKETATNTFVLQSSAFKEGDMIPSHYTCDGNDISPSLSWTAPPPGTKTFALICDDPDAPGGTWTHWLLWNLSADIRELREAVPTTETITQGKQGKNDFNKIGYGGPCPPQGKAHRYYFKLYALDVKLNSPSETTKQPLLEAMKGHILMETQLMGQYQRK
jgi:hypothetical protein